MHNSFVNIINLNLRSIYSKKKEKNRTYTNLAGLITTDRFWEESIELIPLIFYEIIFFSLPTSPPLLISKRALSYTPTSFEPKFEMGCRFGCRVRRTNLIAYFKENNDSLNEGEGLKAHMSVWVIEWWITMGQHMVVRTCEKLIDSSISLLRWNRSLYCTF